MVYFALSPDFAGAISNADFPVRVFHNYKDYDRARPDSYCFVIGSKKADKASKLLKNLRSDTSLSFKPMFLLTSLGDTVDHLSDGIVHTLGEAFESATAIYQKLQELDLKGSTDPEDQTCRLIGHLYARNGYILEPNASWKNEKFYTYPLVDAMLKAPDSVSLLQYLSDRNLIEPARLVDRLHQCSQCEGTHLNYVDICPHCSSIDITQIPFLHCYTCGHVAPEEGFLIKGALMCPNCEKRLRHIGADYDRPPGLRTRGTAR